MFPSRYDVEKTLEHIKLGGLLAAFEYWQNQAKLFDSNFTSLGSKGSSISDQGEYLSAVEEATIDLKTFKKFRRSKQYQSILEHVDFGLGLKYLELVAQKENNYVSDFDKLRILSKIGSPPVYSFSHIGRVSPTIIRYYKVASDLNSLFGDLSKFRISEIGIGFGGQSAVLSSICGVKRMNWFDIPVVLKLADKFITETNVKLNIDAFDGRSPNYCSSDLVISNYAFSELNGVLQKEYLEKVILNSKRGYITWNDMAFQELGGFSKESLIEIIPGSQMLDENPLTAPNNVVIVWGQIDS